MLAQARIICTQQEKVICYETSLESEELANDVKELKDDLDSEIKQVGQSLQREEQEIVNDAKEIAQTVEPYFDQKNTILLTVLLVQVCVIGMICHLMGAHEAL